MKRFLLFAFICFGIISAQAQNPKQNVSLNAPRPKVGVVLCGGGAKGAAHIGVLKYMEEMGIPVDYVAGTSMGSIIGGLYAAGYSPDEMNRLISQMDWSSYIGNKIDRTYMSEEVRKRTSTNLISLPFGLSSLFDKDSNSSVMDQLPSAYVNNSSLVNLFNGLCVGYQEDMDFNDMPIPFACVATDMLTGQEVDIRSGVLPTAMRASMAIPGVFAPVQMGDMILVDGGLVNNFPADLVREMGADIIIGVEITQNEKITPDELKSLPQLLSRLVTNATNTKREQNRELCNIHIVPDITGYGTLSFTADAIDTLVMRGYKMASRYHDQFQAIKDGLEKANSGPIKKELHAPRAKNLASDSVFISSMEITGVTEQQSRWLIRKGQLKPGRQYVQSDIERAVSIYRGTGCFDDITYNVKEEDSLHANDQGRLSNTYDLTIDMKPAHPHVLGVGIRYDTEEGAALLINIGLNEKKFGGSKLSLTGKLSYNPRFNATYTYSHTGLANFNVAYDYRDEHFGLYKDSTSVVNLHFMQHKASAFISQFHLLNVNTTVGAYYASSHFDSSSLDSNDTDSTYNIDLFFKTNKYITPFVTFSYDNLDNAYFANQGVYTRIAAHLYVEPGCTNPLPFDISYAFKAYITPGKGKFSIIPQIYGRSLFNGPNYFNLWNHIGGEIEGRHFEDQLPFIGVTKMLTSNDHSAILRCDLRYNIFGKHYVTAMYNALLELSTPQENDNQYHLGAYHGVGLKYSYNSFLGPISLTGQWCNITNAFSLYFSIGYTF